MPAELVVPLPVGMTAQTGALAEPAGVALRIGELAGQVEGETVLVIGAGPIGLLALQALQARGAPAVFIADISPERLAMGEALGGRPIDPRQDSVVEVVREATRGDGVSVSVDAVGTAETRTNCVAATRSTGTVILSGLHEETSAMPAADVIRREIVVQGSFAYTPQNFTDAIAWLVTGDVTLDPWVVEDALENGGDWFARLVDEPGDVAKVLLKP